MFILTKQVINRSIALAITLWMLCFAPAIASGPPVGTEIVNQAAIVYIDATGVERLATTNEVVLTVNQVYSATLVGDRSLFGAAGQEITFFHTLVNQGNGPDTFTVTVADDNTAADSGDYDLITVYNDGNQNGQLDSGEISVASTASGGDITLAADETVSLLVIGRIPGAAVDDNTFGLTLTVTPSQGSVTDIGADNDSSDNTNEDTVTVSSDAVLMVSKDSAYDTKGTESLVDDEITYTLTVKNIGTADAHDVVLFDGIPVPMAFIGGSLTTGDFAGSGDFAPTNDSLDSSGPHTEADLRSGAGADLNADGDIGDASELQLAVDLNNDGDTDDDNRPIVYAVDDVLVAGNSVSFSYRVAFASPSGVAAGTEINNTAHVAADINGGGAGGLLLLHSNSTVDRVPGRYGVTITDTGDNTGGDGVNDGRDDNSANDIQYVDTVTRGAAVLFTNRLTNSGNAVDTFNLTVPAENFPAGTAFLFYAADRATPLLDTNGDNIIDSGPLAAGASFTLTVKAFLPVAAVGGGSYEATIRAESVGDSSKTDTVTERLGTIIVSLVDLANSNGAAGFNDNGTADADPAAGITTTLSAAPGSTVTFPLFVANESGSRESYLLSVWADSGATTALGSQWTVVFTATAGNVITRTPAINSGEAYEFRAVVTVAENGTPGTTSLFFKVDGATTGAMDRKQDAVTVEEVERLRLTPDQTATAAPCESVEFIHTLANAGNTAEEVIISVTSQSHLSHILLLPTASAGNEATDFVEVQNLAIGSNVAVYDAGGGNWTTVALTDGGGGKLAIPLAVNDETRVKVRVFVPCSTAMETLDQLVLNATVKNGSAATDNLDQTRVTAVHLTIHKLGALDADCDGTEDVADLFVTSNVAAEPGQCVIWKVTVINQGKEAVCNVTVKDRAPAFTSLNGLPAIISQPLPGTGSCAVNGQQISCTLGNSYDITGSGSEEPYCLQPGENGVVHFRVVIQ